MCTLLGLPQVKAAEKLEVQFEEMSIPIQVDELSEWVDGIAIPSSIKELSRWASSRSQKSDLSRWLNLLDLESRAGLAKLLKAPLIKDRSMARQIIRSWVGRQLLDQVSDLIRLDEDRSGVRVFNTLESLLENQREVTTMDLLEGLPGETIYLDLDAFLQLADRWRDELKNQKQLVNNLKKFPSKQRTVSYESLKTFNPPSSKLHNLSVEHRENPLTLEIWSPSKLQAPRSTWIVFMPGWGGTPHHFRWLARHLSSAGWPVVLLEHPGSDAKAVQALLEGKRAAPGAEVLPDRLKDLYSVIGAKEKGEVKIAGKRVVLMGHSLGALTAFVAAGANPESGLERRCNRALDALSLTNLSQLLQCQIVDVPLFEKQSPLRPASIVAINSFGSLLWPSYGGAKISSPVLLTGGTYDLITPAISEQLGLLLSTSSNPFSRALLIEGASHFSPVRVEGQLDNSKGEDLFQLGEAFVGVQPLAVQNLLGNQIYRFLESMEKQIPIPIVMNQNDNGLLFHIMDRSVVGDLLYY